MQNALIENSDIQFGNRLRKAREAKGLDPQAATERMGITYPTVMNHETGYRGARRRIMAYARIYGVNYNWLDKGRLIEQDRRGLAGLHRAVGIGDSVHLAYVSAR